MLLIKNVKVIDGTGRDAYPADVLVNNDKISAIGNFANKKTDSVIEGLGGYLAPGFIDVNTDSDHLLTLFTNPNQENFLLQGVTTIIGGHCGSSLAPLLYGSLESIQKWTDINKINVDWHSFAEFVSIIKKLRLGVNFGSLVGHSTIRRALIGNDQRDLTEKEIRVFQNIIKEALEQGALGFSSGLAYAHSRLVPYGEIKTLVATISKYNAIYTTHLRDEHDGIYNSVNETLSIFKETGVGALISHFRPLLGYESNFDKSYDLINKSAGAMDFHFDIYPFDTSIVPIYTFLPLWARRGGLRDMLRLVKNPETQRRIQKELPRFKKGEVAVAYSPNNKFLENKEVKEKDLLSVMIAAGLRALVFYKNIDYDRVRSVIFSDKALIASNSGGLGERSVKTFTKFLELAVAQKKYSIEKAIQKITSLPAKKFNIKNRGVIKEGYQADLNLILNNQIKYVVVNGEVAVRQGVFKSVRSGQIISRV